MKISPFAILIGFAITSVAIAIKYDMDKIMETARKEVDEQLRQSTINGASSRRFARKKFTSL